ncbi:hypothetical protein JCM11641_006188 [Rhodosporidiobolus odoratus]
MQHSDSSAQSPPKSSLNYHFSAPSPLPSFSTELAGHPNPAVQNLHDLFPTFSSPRTAHQPLGHAVSAESSAAANGKMDSEGTPGGDFQDLLAQFTLPGGALSPAAAVASLPAGTEQGQATGQDLNGLMAIFASLGGAAGVNASSPLAGGNSLHEGAGAAETRNTQDLLMEQLRGYHPLASSTSTPDAGSKQQSGHAQSPHDSQYQLSQLLTSSVTSGSGVPTPTLSASHEQQPPCPAAPLPASSHPSYPPVSQSRPHSQGSSTHASPGAHYPPSSLPPSYPSSVSASHYHQSQYAASSLPPLQAGFAFTPALQHALTQPPFLQQGQQNPITLQAQLAAMQLLINAQAQVQAQAQQAQAAAHTQALAAAQAQMQRQGTPGLTPGGAQGSSGVPSLDGSYRENEYLFSPLLSPAMTPHSAFTNASSLPPSVGPVPGSSGMPFVSPADFFPPLTSPALGPHLYPSDTPAARLVTHRNSLQGLVDGVGTLSTQLPPPQSPSGYMPSPSPRMGPSDSGANTGAGAGRRGASAGTGKKSRPSPLIKPTDAGAERRRRKTTSSGVGAGLEKRAGGTKSATSSPFLGPSSGNGRPATLPGGSSSASASAASIDTPSPVDLSASAMQVSEGLPVPLQSLQAQSRNAMLPPQSQPPASQPHHHEPMGPPPLPSAIPQHLQHLSSSLQQQQQQGHAAPLTPSSFMNLPSDFDPNSLSSLSPALGPVTTPQYDPTSSALSSLHNSPALLPQAEATLPFLGGLPDPAMTPSSTFAPLLNFSNDPSIDAQMKEAFFPPPLPSASTSSPASSVPASGKAARPRKGSSSTSGVFAGGGAAKTTPSPAIKPVDVKGKGKAVAAGTGAGTKKASAPQKIAPAPASAATGAGAGTGAAGNKERKLLPSGTTPDAQARLAAKSNYQNILSGDGSLLGLPASTSSHLQAAAASGGADTRRSSHKLAEQKRRDSLKLCFDELRILLPPILPYTDESDRRPGDGNVGGQRHGELDPTNPNKGVSKVALLRRSNEYLDILRERIERRDRAIVALRSQIGVLRQAAGLGELEEDEEEVPGLDLDLDAMDKEERAAGNLAFYEDLDFDSKAPTALSRRPSRRSTLSTSTTGDPTSEKDTPKRRSTRTSQAALQQQQQEGMEVEAAL